jgi:hypothetical protein
MKWSLQTFQRCLVQPGFSWRSFAQKRHAEPEPRANGGAFPLAVVCPNFGFIRIKLGFLVFSTPWLMPDVLRIAFEAAHQRRVFPELFYVQHKVAATHP